VEPIQVAFRREKGRIVAGLVRMLGSLEEAEDCFSEAVESALKVWPERGQPAQPGAWLTTVARRKALDRLRKLKLQDRFLPPEEAEPDERLNLLFTAKLRIVPQYPGRTAKTVGPGLPFGPARGLAVGAKSGGAKVSLAANGTKPGGTASVVWNRRGWAIGNIKFGGF